MTAAFAGLDVELRNATESLLPIFQSQLNATAGTLNGVGAVAAARPRRTTAQRRGGRADAEQRPARARRADRQRRHQSRCSGSTTRTAHSLSGSSTAPRGWLSRPRTAEYGRRTGELADFLDRAGIAAGALLPTAGNLGVGLGRVFEVGISGGANMLLGVERLSQRFADFTGSVAGER